MDGPPENDFCSICHGNFLNPCQANCSHWFCGNCIIQVWYHNSALQPCKCPLCRRQISLLVPSEASSRERHNPEVLEILQKIEAYNRQFGGQSNGIYQRMQDLPFLIRRLFRDLTDPQRTLPFVIRARVYLAIRRLVRRLDRPVDIIKIPKYQDFISTGFPRLSCFMVIMSAIYVISPVDIIPESVTGLIGLLDDLIIVLICFLHVAALYRSVLLFRHGGS